MSAWQKLWRLALIFAIAAGIWTVIHLLDEVSTTANEAKAATAEVHKLSLANTALVTSLQSALVESCEVNGNAQRQVTRETLHEEINSAEHPDPGLIEALNIPPATIERITQESIAKLRDRLSRVHAVNCASQYRISPGSGARRRAKP